MLVILVSASLIATLISLACHALLISKHKSNLALQEMVQRLLSEQRQEQQQQRATFDKHQLETIKALHDSLKSGMQDIRQQLSTTLKQQTEALSQCVNRLSSETQQHLNQISQQVDNRLSEGFKKTNETFVGVIQRLTIIDQAQKKITELSNDVVSLQDVLLDKRARGAFGEVQLNALIRNMLPEKNFALQYELGNKTRVDCILFLPQPTGNVAIDAKFPMENYQILSATETEPTARQQAIRQFRQDIRKHVRDIASKYIIPGETSDGAVMFIPAEAIFAEIHSHFPELVEEAYKARVWLVSPTTMMAILTTARAVLKDVATRKQVHIIQEHLIGLSKDFDRFQDRMDKLAKHIQQAQQDVDDVHKSSKKISSRFNKIEKVELTETS